MAYSKVRIDSSISKSAARADMSAENSGEARCPDNRDTANFEWCTCGRSARQFEQLEACFSLAAVEALVKSCPATAWCAGRALARTALNAHRS